MPKREVVEAAVRDALPEYGCTDYGTWEEQTTNITNRVMDALEKENN
jgi:hypothetical protein